MRISFRKAPTTDRDLSGSAVQLAIERAGLSHCSEARISENSFHYTVRLVGSKAGRLVDGQNVVVSKEAVKQYDDQRRGVVAAVGQLEVGIVSALLSGAAEPVRWLDRLLRCATRLLPLDERNDWLEEQQGYLADLSSLRSRWSWVLRQLTAMPRYAYTVRTGREREPA